VSERSPSTVFGLTARNGETHLAEALESLLGQTRRDLAIVVVDDCSTDSTQEIARQYAELDPRVVYERNDRQLGLVRNWRRAFDLAGECFPAATYFAWASDHDVWHPKWLEVLGAELDAHPEAVLASPLSVRVDDFGSEYPTRGHAFETAGVRDATERLRLTARELAAAGNMIYGLGRREAFERCGPFPRAVLPDRVYLIRLALEGSFRQVPRRLWYRRYRAGVEMSSARQRRVTFPDGVPAWAYLPWSLTHPVLLAQSVSAERGRIGRIVLVESARHSWKRRRERVARRLRWKRRERRQQLRRLLGRGGPPQIAGPAEQGAPGVAEALDGLERAELLDALTVVLDLGDSGLVAELSGRFPGIVSVPHGTERAELAVSVGALEGSSDVAVEAVARGLHELGVPALYSLDRDSPGLRAALSRWYWLRDVWVEQKGATGRKPDPTTGPVPREPGSYRHLVGRRRLIPGGQS
jgi:glycosyltransferase involved in cell wall biosynthesis